MAGSKKKVYFLFINGPHHVFHLIEPALNFCSKSNDYESIFISGNPVNTDIINTSKKLHPYSSYTLIDLPMPLRYRLLKSYKNKLYPPVYTRFNKIVSKLSQAHAIVSTSHSTPKYMRENKIEGPLLFYLYHGTGTREYGFDDNLNNFDYILAPGPYHRDRLMRDKICVREKILMIGQPKFDWIRKHHADKKKLFNNNNPIFYYNPHWDMTLSSYLKWRNIILDYFRVHPGYNLIFAPHPLVKHFAKNNYKIESEINSADNIIIDLGSSNVYDGTYNVIADVYIGDVSSMVTEWINYNPRPCIFINCHKIKWEENKNYGMWNFGLVINSPKKLDKVVNQSLNKNKYYKEQIKHGNKFLHKEDRIASKICADYIFEKLESGND